MKPFRQHSGKLASSPSPIPSASIPLLNYSALTSASSVPLQKRIPLVTQKSHFQHAAYPFVSVKNTSLGSCAQRNYSTAAAEAPVQEEQQQDTSASADQSAASPDLTTESSNSQDLTTSQNKILDSEPVYRTPQSAIFIPNLFTHRHLPSEKQLSALSNKELVAQVLKVKDQPLHAEISSKEMNRLSKYNNDAAQARYMNDLFRQKDISQYEFYLDEFKTELNKYKKAYTLKLDAALTQLQHSKPDISLLVPEHFKKTVHKLKLERKAARPKRFQPQKNEKEEEDEDEDEDDDDDEGLPKTKDGQVASRSNLRLSYRDNYRIPRFGFESLRKELQLLKLMDNNKTAHRQYMIKCNLHFQENQDRIAHSLLSKNGVSLPSDLKVPHSVERMMEPSRNNSAVLPLESAGVEVNFNSVTKPHLKHLLSNREKTEDFLTIVDVRSRIRAFDNRLPGAVNIPLGEILKGALSEDNDAFQTLYGVPKIPQRHTLIFYADHEKDAIMGAALAFLKHGYQNVFVYKGGVADWFGDAHQPLWYRTRDTKLRDFSDDREKWLTWYSRNYNHKTQKERSDSMLRRFIQKRLPEDNKTLRALKQYTEARMIFEKQASAQQQQHLPFIGGTDYRDGISAELLHSIIQERLSQLEYVNYPLHDDVKRIHDYQSYYGPGSQETQV